LRSSGRGRRASYPRSWKAMVGQKKTERRLHFTPPVSLPAVMIAEEPQGFGFAIALI
jgi:hypothetical protein